MDTFWVWVPKATTLLCMKKVNSIIDSLFAESEVFCHQPSQHILQHATYMEDSYCDRCRSISIDSLLSGYSLGSYNRITSAAPGCVPCALVRRSCELPAGRGVEAHEIVLRHTLEHYDAVLCLVSWANRTKNVIGKFRVWTREEEADQAGRRSAINDHGMVKAYGRSSRLALMRTWLEICSSSHAKCKRTLSDFQIPKDECVWLPPRLLEVGSPDAPILRLVLSNGRKDRYATLSYCWGAPNEDANLCTTTATLEAHLSHIDAERLPRTVRHAVGLTRQLGLRYLWVDRMCVVQDDEEDWRRQSMHMGTIYENAYVTIAATSATSCDDGLSLLHDFDDAATAEEHRTVRLPCTLSSVSGSRAVYMSRLTDDAEDFEDEVTGSQWYGRGWVVQERTLSRRIVHIGRHQVFWECQEAEHQERRHITLPTRARPLAKPALFTRMIKETTLLHKLTDSHHHLRTVASSMVTFKDKLRHMMGGAADLQEADMILDRLWPRIATIYNCSELTFANDKVPALQGLAQSFARRSGLTYAYGLWLEDIARGLYWVLNEFVRSGDGDNGVEEVTASTDLARSQAKLDIPTWSWMASHGSIKMGSFMAELDPGRPRATSRCLNAFRSSASTRKLEILAHCFTATPTIPLKTRIFARDTAIEWKTSGFRIFPPFDMHIDEQLRDKKTIEIEIHASLGGQEASFTGHIHPDQAANRSMDQIVPAQLLCAVMCAENVRHVSSRQQAIAYYLLVLKAAQEHNHYKRIGIGVAVSTIDVIPQTSLGRSAPTEVIVLI